MFLNLCKIILRVFTVPDLVTILHMGSFEEVSLLKDKILFCDIKSIGYDMWGFFIYKICIAIRKVCIPNVQTFKKNSLPVY